MSDNPFRAGLETERAPAPGVFVIFGASGDLTRRKLLPSGMSIVGFASTEISETEFREAMRKGVSEFSRRKPIDEALWNDFASRLHYVSGKFEDPSSFARLAAK